LWRPPAQLLLQTLGKVSRGIVIKVSAVAHVCVRVCFNIL